MATPKWITPAGQLGIVPELEYYQFPLDAYDASGGTLVFSLISGRLPRGIQVVPTGKLQGIPVSELEGDVNVDYRFTIRVKNSSTNSVADRTFSLTITNVAPPIITPRDVDLGIILDGTVIDLQLEAIEFTPGATLVWSLKRGELPNGLTLSSSGLLSGYIEPIESLAPGTEDGWDESPWAYLGWDFPQATISKTFTFSVEVFDGVNYDVSTYTLEVIPKGTLTADNNVLTVDTTVTEVGGGLEIDTGLKHNPIITTTQSDLIEVREGSYFAFDINAIDLDGDILNYSVPSLASGAFDEQTIVANAVPYITRQPIGGNLYAGMYPEITSVILDNETIQTVDTSIPGLVNGDIIKVLSTTDTWQEATVNNHTSIRLRGNVKVQGSVGNIITQELGGANATITNISITSAQIRFSGNLVTANVGEYITQAISGANAVVLSNVSYSRSVDVELLTTTGFVYGTGNIKIAGANVTSLISNVSAITDLSCYYNTVDAFTVRPAAVEGIPKISGVSTKSTLTDILSVGVTLGGASTEGTLGFDETKFDQGTLALPGGLTINLYTGWITGILPGSTINETEYQFEVIAYKRDEPDYRAGKLFTLTVLGDLNNRINWITPSDLGTIENGRVSDLYIQAESTRNKPLYYKYKINGDKSLPQGLILLTNGLLSGRVSFQVFSLDAGVLSLDGGDTSFDTTYTFTVTAHDYLQTVSSDRTFTIRVVQRNIKPYEDLYLRAFPNVSQRDEFNSLLQNRSIFPTELIYRSEDPFFGIAKEVKTLFLPGLEPSKLEEYAQSLEDNHYTKRITLGEIKSAVAVDTNFDVKYEVIYLELLDSNTSADGRAPADSIDLTGVIDTPYYDKAGNSYTTITPNAFENMQNTVVSDLGYANKGALPDWMTSKQPNGRVLGFTRAVVLAYLKPGASDLIKYRLSQVNFQFNQLDFTIDRYLLDNNYSENYDVDAQAFLASNETTFDRYPSIPTVFTNKGSVNYAVSTAFEDLNNKSVAFIKANDGFDGYKNFKDGDLLVFAEQEFFRDQNDLGEYNQGWSNVEVLWDSTAWDYDSDVTDNPYTIDYGYLTTTWTANTSISVGYTVYYSGYYYLAERSFVTGAVFSTNTVVGSTTVTALTLLPTPNTPDLTTPLAWDKATYIPGYNENLLDPSTDNQRIGIWRINIVPNTTSTVNDDLVKLTFVSTMDYYDKVFVRNGYTYGGTNIYYDSVIKANKLIANYSIIPQQISTNYTTFDGNGTKFYDYRDSYTVPGAGDKYIKFAKTGVFT